MARRVTRFLLLAALCAGAREAAAEQPPSGLRVDVPRSGAAQVGRGGGAAVRAAVPQVATAPPKLYEQMLRGSDFIGTASFAVSGAMAASEAQMDLLGQILVGTVTAVGGGTIRDVLTGGGPVFWLREKEYLWCSVAGALSAFLLRGAVDLDAGAAAHLIEATDVLGLAAFCVIGARNGLARGLEGISVVFCGLCTACFGGVFRDLLCKQPVRIMHSFREVYGSCALTGAAAYFLVARHVGDDARAVAAGRGIAAACRIVGRSYGLTLPC